MFPMGKTNDILYLISGFQKRRDIRSQNLPQTPDISIIKNVQKLSLQVACSTFISDETMVGQPVYLSAPVSIEDKDATLGFDLTPQQGQKIALAIQDSFYDTLMSLPLKR